MKWRVKPTKRIIASIAIILATLTILALIITNFPPISISTIKETKISLSWKKIVETIASNSERLKIECYATGMKISINKSSNYFSQVIGLLETSHLEKLTSKTVVTGNMTGYVTIPYPYCYLLTFELNNGTKLILDLVPNDTIWYETKYFIYKIKTSPSLVELIENLLSQADVSLTKYEVYKEGLKLVVILSSTKLKCGDSLTINTFLLNVNNTANITVAALHGGIFLRIFNSQNEVVYAVKMVIPGPTPPPVLKPGDKINAVFKWDTSENVINKEVPPAPGEYYLEIEAYVTDMNSQSKIILKTDRIPLKLSERR